MSEKDKSISFAKLIMEKVLEDGILEKTKTTTVEEHLQITQKYVDAMVRVSGRLIVAHLMKRMSEGAAPASVAEDALAISETVAHNLLLSVDAELSHALNIAEDLIVGETKTSGKTKSSMDH